MTKANLNNEREQIIFGDDSIVIQKYISGIKGGRTLDVTGFSEKVIKAGHIIIRKDSDGTYKPMPVTMMLMQHYRRGTVTQEYCTVVFVLQNRLRQS